MAIGSKKYYVQIWKTRALLAVVLVFSGLLTVALYHRLVVQRDMIERRKDVETEKMRLEDRHAEIQQKAEYIQSDAGIESEIRRNFDVAKAGESVIILVEDESPVVVATDSASATQRVEVRPWWRFW